MRYVNSLILALLLALPGVIAASDTTIVNVRKDDNGSIRAWVEPGCSCCTVLIRVYEDGLSVVKVDSVLSEVSNEIRK